MSGNRDDMVDHVALAGPFGRSCGWAGVLLLELLPGGLRPCVLLGGWPSATPPSRMLRSAKKRQLPYFHLAEKPFPADPTVPPSPRFGRVIASLIRSLFLTNNSKNSGECVKGWTLGQHEHVGRHRRAASSSKHPPCRFWLEGPPPRTILKTGLAMLCRSMVTLTTWSCYGSHF